MRRVILTILISSTVLSSYSYSFDASYNSNLNIDSIINEKINRENLDKEKDVRIMYNLLHRVSKDDYSSFNDIVANYPEVKTLFSQALYDAGIAEIEIIDEKGIAYIEFALMKLEDKLKERSGDINKLSMLISTNSSNGCISCMDLGVVIMQYVVAE